ncbi:MAG: dihydroorotate dehydrogenase electron transfer subunit [Xanthobacteraceae bacterium]|nr:MAG: dihydroorotate dehydrogenase electron transfer subunit [Xanthobacteraceae bacterium]
MSTLSPIQPRPIRAEVCRVVFNTPLHGPYRHLAVTASATALAAMPGQFFQLLCPGQGQDRHTLRRPMSVYRVDHARGQLEFLFKIVGAGTRGLSGLAAGDELDIFGPLGQGFRLNMQWRHIVLLGRGAGMATLAPLAETAIARGMKVTAILSAARPELAVAADHLRAAGAEVRIVNDADGSAAPEWLEPVLRQIVTEQGVNFIATCGSGRLLRLVRRLHQEFGIDGQVALEQPMACGIGSCFCCVRPFVVDGQTIFKRVCQEGPVFAIQEAA